jgi:selenide, water dikinase
VGFGTSDDAGVYRIREDLALVQTVDLITPVCDDPFIFGQVAAANALSDVYAMGGRPLTALNICCFPGTGVPEETLAEILRGALDKVREARAVLVGGHTVKDAELKYGLAVTGTIHPDRILRNVGARAGERLVLTKPVGTGLVIGGARKELIGPEELSPVLAEMARLNDVAAEEALAHGATAATDITGFGLAAHALEMVRGSGVGLRLWHDAIPFHTPARAMGRRGVSTAMTASNRTMTAGDVEFDPSLDEIERLLYFDPQTSGGLMVSVPAAQAEPLAAALRARGVVHAAVVGEVVADAAPLLRVEGGA